MKVPTKIRLLGYVRKIFPEWAIRRQAAVIEHAFDDDLKAAKDEESQAIVLQERHIEAEEFWNALEARRSQKLARLAQKFFIVIDDKEWQSDQYANFYFDSATQAKLHRLIVEERRKVWDFRVKIAGTIIGALTGLLGALIGVLAFLQQMKPKR